MRDSDGVFTRFHEALRLPDHFGWNWNAMRDCLSDLHWINAKHFLLTVDDADVVLSESPEERKIFLRSLNYAATFWAGKPDLSGQERPPFGSCCCALPKLSRKCPASSETIDQKPC